MKLPAKHSPKLHIKSNKKSYLPSDSALYNLTTKKRLEAIIGKTIAEIEAAGIDENYRVFGLKKGGKTREIQAPKYSLDVIHTRIASLLVRVAVPDYLHSGIKGRSNITNAKAHIGNHPLLTMDIQKFYPSISKKSIFNFFHIRMNASRDVAGILAEVCSYKDCLPTGSRISMPLSFWVNYEMYSKLESLCLNKGIIMTVFVDDFTFSGDQVDEKFKKHAKKIIKESGLEVHPRKTRLFGKGFPRVVTGALVDGSGIKVRNKHHKSIYTLFGEIEKCSDDKKLEKMQMQLLGKLSAAGQIDKSFKNKAAQFRKAIC
ncbi:MAG: RNA-directed DNA polymerase [Pseudohongiella sp.]|nr:RNA-directed DNA polymerase [Pseudohongiella sp.]